MERVRKQWGGWSLKKRGPGWVVQYGEGADYEVDLDTCTSSAGILNWAVKAGPTTTALQGLSGRLTIF